MPRKKKSSDSVPLSPNRPIPSPENSEETLTNLKAKNSDENLMTTSVIVEPEKIKKRSMISLPTEGEEEDEFLFIRLRKQIKGHWDKIMENGNMLFRPQHNSHNSHDTEINRSDSVKTTTTVTSTSTSSSATTKSPVENNFFSSSIKSVLLLPAFSCNRDDEGRKVVPFISSLLQVKTLSLRFIFSILCL
jgi:hypothetical protein